MMHTDELHNTWIPCYFIPTRTNPRKRERKVLTCMWLLTSLDVSPISLISGLESCDLWPLPCLTAPVPQPDVSPRCHVSSCTVTVVSGCLAPQSPWLLPREGVREGGRSHLPLPCSDGGERRAWGSAWLLEIQHIVLPNTIPIGGKEKEKEKARWKDCTVAICDNVGSFQVKNCAYGDSKVTQDQFSFC